MKYLIFGAIAASTIGLMVACAPIDEDQCRTGNWAGLGVRDGQNGALVSRFSTYQKECAQYGIAPNQAEWLAGREQGLKTYCTPHSAYETGKRGRELNNVCSNMEALVEPNKAGLRYHSFEERIDDLEDRARELENKIRREFTGELSVEQIRIGRQYRRLLNDIEYEIEDLKNEQIKLPRY